MARYVHKSNGVVVEVSDETAKRLGGRWEPVEKPASKKAAAKSDEK